MAERWVSIYWNRNYEVSDEGRVRRVTGGRGAQLGKVLKQHSNGNYLQVSLFCDNVSRRVCVHLLVAEAFHGNRPDGMEVNHKDGDHANNRETNLEYLTHKQNMDHARVSGLLARGMENGSGKLTDAQVSRIRFEWRAGAPQRALAKKFGVSYQHISDILLNKKRTGVANV